MSSTNSGLEGKTHHHHWEAENPGEMQEVTIRSSGLGAEQWVARRDGKISISPGQNSLSSRTPSFLPFHRHLLVQISFTLLLESNPILDS